MVKHQFFSASQSLRWYHQAGTIFVPSADDSLYLGSVEYLAVYDHTNARSAFHPCCKCTHIQTHQHLNGFKQRLVPDTR